ncbi:VIT1/CCC1 transporter family protein [Nanoarchaeota archaeon]
MKPKQAEKIIKSHEEGNHEKYHSPWGGKYLGDLVYGANDGIITTFAVVSAVTGASLEAFIVLIVGFANLLADGVSMAVGNYLAIKSDHDFMNRQKQIEEWEVENIPDHEREEVRVIYRNKGLTGKLLEQVVDKITQNKKVWVDVMMKEELMMCPDEDIKAWKNGLATLIAFIVAGFLPLMPYAFAIEPMFELSIILTGVTMFIVGAARAIVTARNWFRSGIEMLAVGAIAAVVAYLVGYFLRGLGV